MSMPLDHPDQSNEPVPESTGALHVPDIRTVKVSNVSTTVNENDIKEFLTFSGDIHFIELQKENESSQLFYVTFKESKGADTASLLSGAIIAGQSVSITPVEDYQLPPEAYTQDSQPQLVAGNAIKTAEDVVSSMLAKGYVLGVNAIGRAKAFDERMKLSSNASAKVASIDNRIGFRQKVSTGAAVVNDKVREMDERYQVSGKARSAYMVAEQKASSAGSVIMSNRYVAAGATWVSGAISAVSKAAEDVTTMTKEKLEKAENNKKETLSKETPEEAQATQPAIIPAIPVEEVTTMAKKNIEKAEDNKTKVEKDEDRKRERLINLSETQPEVAQAGQPAIIPATPAEDVTTEEKDEKADDIKTESLDKETTYNNLPETQPEGAQARQPAIVPATQAENVTAEEKVEKADDIKTESLNKETTDNSLPGTQPEVAQAGQPTQAPADA